jgi:hypothetical protein
MTKILIILFILGWVFILAIVAGETHAINNPYSKFTKWWRKNWVGIKDKLN